MSTENWNSQLHHFQAASTPAQFHSIKCVCVCVRVWWFGVCAWTCIYRQFVCSNPRTCSSGMDLSPLDINNFSPLTISLSAASSCSLHIFVRVWKKGGVVSPKGGSRFVPALCLITPPLHPRIPLASSHPCLINLLSLLSAPTVCQVSDVSVCPLMLRPRPQSDTFQGRKQNSWLLVQS